MNPMVWVPTLHVPLYGGPTHGEQKETDQQTLIERLGESSIVM